MSTSRLSLIGLLGKGIWYLIVLVGAFSTNNGIALIALLVGAIAFIEFVYSWAEARFGSKKIDKLMLLSGCMAVVIVVMLLLIATLLKR